MEQEATMKITKSELQDILTTLVKEMRRPPDKTPEQLAREEADRQMRELQSKQEMKIKEDRRAFQRQCQHQHHNGTSATVSVNNGEYLICQHCQGKIKTVKGPLDEEAQEFIYDENLYWKHVGMQSKTTF